MAKELVLRKDVPMEMTWDLTKIYETKQEMDKDIHTIEILRDEILNTYKGKLDTPKQINKCLDQFRKLNELVVLACNYTELAVSVDYYNIEDQEAYGRVNRIVSEVFSDLSFIESEISEQKEQIIQEAIKLTEKNKGYLQDILRNKPHRLHSEAEKVLTAISQTTESPYEVYNAAKLADMQFDSFIVEGKKYPLGYSLFEDDYEYDPRTNIRRAAFENFSEKIKEYENVTAVAYNTKVQHEKMLSKLRAMSLS